MNSTELMIAIEIEVERLRLDNVEHMGCLVWDITNVNDWTVQITEHDQWAVLDKKQCLAWLQDHTKYTEDFWSDAPLVIDASASVSISEQVTDLQYSMLSHTAVEIAHALVIGAHVYRFSSDGFGEDDILIGIETECRDGIVDHLGEWRNGWTLDRIRLVDGDVSVS